MLNGAHILIDSRDIVADRVFFRDVLDLAHIDVGDGWLIFALPPSEVAFHPADRSNSHRLFFMCDDIRKTVLTLESKGVHCAPVETQSWGFTTHFTLPGGGAINIYEPTHKRPSNVV